MKASESKQKKVQAPVDDGDARPDQLNIDPDRKKTLAGDKGRVSKERGADVDSSDDFRDAKRS